MSIDEAMQILRDRGYQIYPMPAHMPRPGYLWMSDEPNIESFNVYSEQVYGQHRPEVATDLEAYAFLLRAMNREQEVLPLEA